MIPNWKIYPRSQGHSTVYLKNVVKDPTIQVGEYTTYDDYVNDPRDFERNCVLYHYPECNGDTLSIGSINLADITRDTTLTFGVALPEGITNLTGINEVTAEVSFHGLATKEMTVAQIEAVNVPEGLEVELITEKLAVTLRGPTELISKVTPEDVTAVVDFTGAEVGTSTFKTSLALSSGFESLGTLKTESVSAKIEKK